MSRLGRSPFHLGEPTEAVRHQLLRDQMARAVTYVAGDGSRYRRRSCSAELGAGDAVFDTASTVLRHWQMHGRAGFEVVAENPSATPGVAVLLTFKLGPVWATVACRVLDVVDTASASGFTYATLPLHAERGEQTFMVSKSEEGRVTFSVSSVSRPNGLVARLGAPVTAILQRRAAARYLDAMRELSGTSRAGSG